MFYISLKNFIIDPLYVLYKALINVNSLSACASVKTSKLSGHCFNGSLRTYATWSGMSKSVRESQYIYPKSTTIKFGSKSLSKIEPNNNCKALTVFGQHLGSSLGLRLTQMALNSISLTTIQALRCLAYGPVRKGGAAPSHQAFF